MSKSSVRIGTRYRPNRVASHYDSIIIGSGIGGLTAAMSLAQMGHKVCVFEQHYTAGGFTHAYENKGYEWDVGVHYIGDVGYDKTITKRLFDFVSGGQLKWAPMDSIFDKIYLGSKTFYLKAGKQQYKEALLEQFPDEAKAIDEYFNLLNQVRKDMRLETLSKVMPKFTGPIYSKLRPWVTSQYTQMTTREALESITDNQALIAVLTGQWGDCGLPPARSSFVIHTLIAQHYLNGGYYPIGGASEIARTIVPNIEALGGQVFTYAMVEKILFKNKKAVGVQMKDGTEIHAKNIISNAGVYNTFEKLIPQSAIPNAYANELKTVKRSMSSLCLYIGIKETAEALSLPKTNLWIYPSEHYESHLDAFKEVGDDFPLVYISFPSAKDPSFAERYPGKATIEIVAPCRHSWFEQWAGTDWKKRGEDYDALKEKLSQQLLSYLYDKMPHLKGKIDFHELSTTLSTDYFCQYKEGEIYGLDHTPDRFAQPWLRPKTSYKGLYLTGQDTLSCGVAGAMISGLLTAVTIERVKSLGLVRKILNPVISRTDLNPCAQG